MQDILIEAKNISKSYQGKQALNNVSINIPRGAIYGLLGPNGAGKTTFIRILTQITAPDSGEILLDGKRLNRADIEKMGYMPEERGLYRKMKVGEQILYMARLKGMSKDEAMNAIRYWFEVLDIKEWWGKKVEELSKGMSQKVQFISTVIHNPSLVILDEPFTGFDPVNSELILNEILKLKEKGVTIVLSTHRMESVEEMCDNLCLINNAHIVLEGEVNEIRQRYKEHVFELVMNGVDASPAEVITNNIEWLGTESNKDGNILYRFRPNGATTANELLQSFIQLGNIVSFREVLPTINDIFIKLVK